VLLVLLLAQIALGLANVHLALPLANALAHNLVAAHLLVCCVLARGRLSRPHGPPVLSPVVARSRI
jgi:cytochrome c oxidase assembly protein subunit 15